MNKSIYIIATLFIGSSLLFSACKDDEDPITPNDPVVEFNFTSPESGDMYHKGDTVFINGNIKFEEEMHGYEVSIINTSQMDTVVFNVHKHEDSKEFQVDEYWVNNVDDHSNMKLIIDAVKDHFGTKETKEIAFHCHPM